MNDFQSIGELLWRWLHPKPPLLLLVSSMPKMEEKDILRWGEMHNWPQLVLHPDIVLKCGEQRWRKLLDDNDSVQIALISQRITQWNELEHFHQRKR